MNPVQKKAAAYLSACGYRNKDIATRLNVDDMAVHRALDEALEQGWLTKPICRFSQEEQNEIDTALGIEPQLQSKLKRVSRGALQEVRVTLTSPKDEEMHFGGGMHLSRMLKDTKLLGCAWGKDLLNTARQLARIRIRRKIKVFPVRAEPISYGERGGASFEYYSVAAVCGTLCDALGVGEFPSLSGVPAILPWRGAVPKEMDQYLRLIPGYRQIAVGKASYLERADTILTSVGPASPVSDWTLEFVKGAGLPGGWKLSDLVFGDVAGVFLPKPGLDSKQRSFLDHASERMVCLNRRHLETCVQRCAESQRQCTKGNPHSGGAIICAYSAVKARATLEAVRSQLVSRLIISPQVAREVDRLISEDAESKPCTD